MLRKQILFCILFTGVLTACATSSAGMLNSTLAPTPTNPLDGSPPPASLEIDGMLQTAGVGTFCWTLPNSSDGEPVNMCVDKIGLPTVRDPLHSKSPMTAQLHLPLDEPPVQLQLSIFEARDENEVKIETGSDPYRYWMPSEGIYRDLALQTSQEFTLELEPGLYVLYVFGVWEGKGDVSYGFLVEAQ